MNNNKHEDVVSAHTHPIYNKEGIFKICLAAISAILAIFTGIFFGIGFNAEDMYFEKVYGGYILGGVIATVAAATVALSLISKAQLSPTRRRGTTVLQYISAIILFLFFLQSVIGKSFWLVIFSLIAIAYFLGLLNKRIVVNTALGVGSVLFFAATVAQTYFDYSIAVNSPYKLLCQFGMAISMLLIATELKLELGSGSTRIYKMISALTFILNASASAASIALVISSAAKINYYFIPCAAMAVYSAKILFARPNTASEPQDTDTTPDEKGTDTDEIVN